MHRLRLTDGAIQLMAAVTLGVVASGSIFVTLEHFEHYRAEAQFQQLAGQRLNSVRTRLAGAVNTINLLASYSEASSETSRRAFSIFVKPALANPCYMQALEWIPRVDRQARSRYERLAHLDGIPDFRFTERREDGSLEVAKDRAEYFPVFYVEPLLGNERALGYDLASNAIRFEALRKAREAEQAVATARVLLVQERGDQYGVLIFAPVYQPLGLERDRHEKENLMGFALGVLRVGDLISQAGDERKRFTGVEIHVFDPGAPKSEQQLYPKAPEISAETLRNGLNLEERVEVAGREWILLATPTLPLTYFSSSASPLVVLAFGLLVTCVFVLYFHTKTAQANQIARAAKELRVANQQLEIHSSEIAEQVRLLALGADIGVILTQDDGLETMLQRCASTLVKHLGAACARIWTLREDGDILELRASAGLYTQINGAHVRVPLGSFKIGRIAQDRRPDRTNAVMDDLEISDLEWAKGDGTADFAGFPLIVEDRLVGVAALFAGKPLAESVFKALASIADEIALGIERKRAEEALRESERRFRIAAENGSDVITVRDLLTNQVRSSGAVERMLPSGRQMPRSFDEFQRLVHPDDRDRVMAAIQRHLQTLEPYRQEFRVVDQDGSVRHWSSRGTAVWNAGGEATQFIVVTTDITAEKQAEAALSHLAAIVEASEASIISVDLDDIILSWNPAAERIYGYTFEEARGRSISIIYPPDRQQELASLLDRMLQQGEDIRHIETVRVRKDGETIPIFVSYSPLRDASGKVVGACSIATDITERKSLERQLLQAQKLESIGQLAAGIAHEINTPIQYVSDNTRFLRDSFGKLIQVYEVYHELLIALKGGADPAPFISKVQAFIESARMKYLCTEIPSAIEDSLDGVSRVADIVRAIKEFSHPGPAEKMPSDLNQAIASTVLVCRNEWKYVAELTLDLDPELPPVQCVAGEFNQVMLNLIVNAAHAIADAMAGKPGAMGTITVSTRRAGDWAEIRVRDTGTGIPEAARPNVFNPFFTTKPVGKGTGQGLSVAYGVIVQKHGGTINFETEIGVGTTFIIRIPIRAPSAENTANDSNDPVETCSGLSDRNLVG
jgi:PAS domain S-box-containing protein